jgi:hypothetical protein
MGYLYKVGIHLAPSPETNMAEQKTSTVSGDGKATKITKVEGLRRALAKLGQNARTEDLQAYLKKQFGFEMTKNHIYVSKGDIRRQDAKKNLAAKPERKVAPALKPKAENAPPATPPENANRAAVPQAGKASKPAAITKIDAIRLALKELGKDATSLAIQGYVKNQFGLEMTRKHITKYKGEERREQAAKKQPKKSPNPANKPEPKPQPNPAPFSPSKQSTGVGGIRLEDIQALKSLLGRVGSNELRKLIDVLSK